MDGWMLGVEEGMVWYGLHQVTRLFRQLSFVAVAVADLRGFGTVR